MIYLDNAATTWPKPPTVLRAMREVLEYEGGNPGRSGHRLSIAAARVIYNTREDITNFFGVSDPLRLIFTSSATHAINLVLMGMLKPGDRVVTSSVEHNAVMRPLRSLEKKRGICLKIVPCASDGSLDVNIFNDMLDTNTKLVVMTHASNVVGTLLPITEIAYATHNVGALLLVDSAQTAGVIPIDMETMGIDLLVFTGHKELQGPPGIGGLVISNKVDALQIEPLTHGGTGSNSESQEQPDYLPDKFESGTPNLPGIAGLGAGLKWIKAKGTIKIMAKLKELSQMLIDGLSVLPGVKVYGTLDPAKSVAIVSFTATGKHVSEIGMRLDEEYGILTRVGLHCAPGAHKTIGSFPEGTIRLSISVFTTMHDVKQAIQAIRKVLRS